MRKIKMKKLISIILSLFTLFSAVMITGCGDNEVVKEGLIRSYSFDETTGNTTKEKVSGKDAKIEYVFSDETLEDKLFKQPSDPLRKEGISGKSLYMDGFSTYLQDKSFTTPKKALALSAWVAPRVFENLPGYGGESIARGNTRLTAIVNQGNIELGEGFLFGYGRLGLWGIQLALTNVETMEEFVVAFYDPLNALPLYQWSHLAVSFDGTTGYIGLFYNGTASYESFIPELKGTEIITSASYIPSY